MSIYKVPRTREQEMKHDQMELFILLLGIISLICEMFYLLIVKGV